MRLVIHGAPRTKKNHQRIARARDGRRFVLPAKQYERWAGFAIGQLKRQYSGPPIETPVNMRAIVYRERAVGDLLNYLAAISDVLEDAGVVVDDKWIVSVDGSRMAKDAKAPRVEIEIEVGE